MLDMARAGARALWSLSESRHNKELMCKSGIVPLMGRLLKSVHIDVVVPTMGTIQQCASQANYQLAITTEGMIFDIVSHLTSDNLDLKRQCSSAIFKCASDKVGGLKVGGIWGEGPNQNIEFVHTNPQSFERRQAIWCANRADWNRW